LYRYSRGELKKRISIQKSAPPEVPPEEETGEAGDDEGAGGGGAGVVVVPTTWSSSGTPTEVGLYKPNPVVTHKLETAWLPNPC
jgi:hypothetical protein